MPDDGTGPSRALLFSGSFAALWLISAAFFRASNDPSAGRAERSIDWPLSTHSGRSVELLTAVELSGIKCFITDNCEGAKQMPFRYRTTALAGAWRDTLEEATNDAMKAGQAYREEDCPTRIVWRADARIEKRANASKNA
jgi:hypothetical protein